MQEDNKPIISAEEVLCALRAVALSEAGDESGSSLKYSSKLKALELLGKHTGIFEQRGTARVLPENNLLEQLAAFAEEEEEEGGDALALREI